MRNPSLFLTRPRVYPPGVRGHLAGYLHINGSPDRAPRQEALGRCVICLCAIRIASCTAGLFFFRMHRDVLFWKTEFNSPRFDCICICIHISYTSKHLLRRYLDLPNPPHTPSQKVLGRSRDCVKRLFLRTLGSPRSLSLRSFHSFLSVGWIGLMRMSARMARQ